MQDQGKLSLAILWLALALVGASWIGPIDEVDAAAPGQGSLTIIEPDGKPGAGCPLEHTSVKSEISGFVARVEVTQTFHNPRKEKIEAIYTFPLSADAAVDDMLMRVGDRVVKGAIKRREEARRIYEQARDRGHVASLLDQERPNIFVQSVANIMPGEKVVITIGYAEVLSYEDGAFQFVFPMVVGPRFIPGTPTGHQGTGWAPDTTAVPDASRITPRVTPEGTRAGHDIDLTVSIDSPVPILGIDSRLHEINVERSGERRAVVSLKSEKEIPNRDFVLTYTVAGEEVRSGVLAHRDGEQGFLTVVMIPPKRVRPDQVAPKEMIFVIDCSGSQTGKPLEKAKETMRYVINHMNPDDTFNIIDFNSGARALFETPRKNTPDNRARALTYLESLQARGGTWMGPAVETVCKSPAPENRIRIVTFMTDGYVGNDFEIVSLVKNLRGKSRWFPFGTGNSVNRFLLDHMARAGGGEVEYVLLNSSGEEVGRKFYERIASPVLTDIQVSYQAIELEEVFPDSVSDLWARKPLIFKAKYSEPGNGTLTIKGLRGGKPYEQKLDVLLPEKEPGNSALASIWARAKVDHLMDRDWMGVQKGAPDPSIKEEIVRVALTHRIMTQYTSFVAVEEAVVTVGGQPTTVAVPVEMPDGVSREGVFGELRSVAGAPGAAKSSDAAIMTRRKMPVPATPTPAFQSAWSSARSLSGPADALKPATEQALNDDRFRRDLEKDERAELNSRWEAKAAALRMKLSPELYELYRLLKDQKKGGNLAHGKIKVTDGNVSVQVLLSAMTDDIVRKIEKAGLKVEFKTTAGKSVVGIISLDKLEPLALIPEVTFIKPIGPA